MSAKSRRREATKKPRAAYCTGCDVTFSKMHLLIEHRRLKRCGGRFLSYLDREYLDSIRLTRESALRKDRSLEQQFEKFSLTGRYT